MRKKSHISLTRYLIENMDEDGLYQHRKAFYIGSILPDCVPSFITRRHCIEDTFEILKKEIRALIENFDANKGINSYYCRKLGVITHYVADYFTFPHNKTFEGSMKEHCKYEKELKFELRSYVRSEEAVREREDVHVYRGVDDICDIIMAAHDEYLKAIKVVKDDIGYIVELCHRVVDCILQIFELERSSIIAQSC